MGFVEPEREKGIYLSVLGFGEGSYQDDMAQAPAQNGNGVAAYIDTLNEARKVLVHKERWRGSLRLPRRVRRSPPQGPDRARSVIELDEPTLWNAIPPAGC